MDAGENAMKVRVEYTYDPESRNWCFQVSSLGIIGGADTREQAEEQAIEATTLTLESANEATAPAESEVNYLCLTVQRSSHEHPATARS
jgi:hypothetical protein